MKYKEIEWIAYGFIAIAMLAIFIRLIGISAEIVQSHSSGGDLATWVGAAGTVGALIGAIFLSTRDFQSRERDARNRARLVAAGLALRIRVSRSAMTAVLAVVRNFPNDESQTARIQNCIMIFGPLDLWSIEELVPLTWADPSLATSLSTMANQITVAIRGLKTLSEMKHGDPAMLQQVASGLAKPLETTLRNSEGFVERCEHIAQNW